MAVAEPGFEDIIADIAVSLGISRPAGRCFAGIWRSAQALSADDLVAVLGLSRSNVSTALKELRGWGLISVRRAPGDRRDYFAAPHDPWDLCRIVMAERSRRVLAPAADRLRQIAPPDTRADALAEMFQALMLRLGELSRLDAEGLAQQITAPTAFEDGKKKKKKKKHR